MITLPPRTLMRELAPGPGHKPRGRSHPHSDTTQLLQSGCETCAIPATFTLQIEYHVDCYHSATYARGAFRTDHPHR